MSWVLVDSSGGIHEPTLTRTGGNVRPMTSAGENHDHTPRGILPIDTQPFYAVVVVDDERRQVRVEAWAATGEALVLDQDAGRLVPATALKGYVRVERNPFYNEHSARPKMFVPATRWRIRRRGDRIDMPIIGWLVIENGIVETAFVESDGTVRTIRSGNVNFGEYEAYEV